MKTLSALVCLLLVAACATLTTNSRSLQTGERTFTVTGFEQTFANARDLAYLRAAQEALAAGYGYFEIVREFDNEEREVNTQPGYYESRTDENGNEYEEFFPPITSVSVTYSYVLEIRTLTVEEAREFEQSAIPYYDAGRIYENLAPRWIPEERDRAAAG